MKIIKKEKILHYTFKIIWSKTYIGIAVDRIQPNLFNNIPISSFYFWPREDGWKLLKLDLEKNSLITIKDQKEILNGYNSIILYWCLQVNSINQTDFKQIYKILNCTILATL